VVKSKQGLGEDAYCTLPNLKNIAGKVTFSLRCTPESSMTLDHQIQYNYSRSKVDVVSDGVMNVAGSALATKTMASSTWNRACTKEEKHQTEK